MKKIKEFEHALAKRLKDHFAYMDSSPDWVKEVLPEGSVCPGGIRYIPITKENTTEFKSNA